MPHSSGELPVSFQLSPNISAFLSTNSSSLYSGESSFPTTLESEKSVPRVRGGH